MRVQNLHTQFLFSFLFVRTNWLDVPSRKATSPSRSPPPIRLSIRAPTQFLIDRACLAEDMAVQRPLVLIEQVLIKLGFNLD